MHPCSFFWASQKNFDAKQCHILIKKDAGEITFVANDTDPHTTHRITGKLLQSSELAQFAINSQTNKFTVQEFLRLIKMNAYYFPDREAHRKLIESLQKWSVQVQRVINEHNDQRGNTNFQLETKVTGVELIKKFDLLIPIFKGYGKKKFTVEIGLDPKDLKVDLYLISDELVELEIREREELVEGVISGFSSFDCSKIVMS